MPQHPGHGSDDKLQERRNTIHKRAKAAAEGAASRTQFRGIIEVDKVLGAIIDLLRRRDEKDEAR